MAILRNKNKPFNNDKTLKEITLEAFHYEVIYHVENEEWLIQLHEFMTSGDIDDLGWSVLPEYYNLYNEHLQKFAKIIYHHEPEMLRWLYVVPVISYLDTDANNNIHEIDFSIHHTLSYPLTHLLIDET